MTTRSLILHAHEVRAALDGRLGLVVRQVKPQPTPNRNTGHWIPLGKGRRLNPAMAYETQDEWRCPLGVPGDRLCCKETWAEAGDFVGWDSPQGKRPEGVGVIAYRADNELRQYSIMLKGPERFKATDLSEYSKLLWRSPATMPSWASRITLEVQGVRCVRLGDLTDDDAIQSLGAWRKGDDDDPFDEEVTSNNPLGEFRAFWTTKYGTRYPWETSWAWEVEVRRVEG